MKSGIFAFFFGLLSCSATFGATGIFGSYIQIFTTTNTVAVSWPSPSTGWTLQQNTNSISTEQLQSGMYVVQVINSKGTISRTARFIKM